MSDRGRELVRRLHLEEIERLRREPPAPPPPMPTPPTTIHYSELKEDPSGDLESANWNVYVREVGRLLKEGNEGKWVILAEGRVFGVYDTEEECRGVMIANSFTWPSSMKQIREWDPVMRVPFWYGWMVRCPS